MNTLISMAKIGKIFSVSSATIFFILNPEKTPKRKERSRKYYKENKDKSIKQIIEFIEDPLNMNLEIY